MTPLAKTPVERIDMGLGSRLRGCFREPEFNRPSESNCVTMTIGVVARVDEDAVEAPAVLSSCRLLDRPLLDVAEVSSPKLRLPDDDEDVDDVSIEPPPVSDDIMDLADDRADDAAERIDRIDEEPAVRALRTLSAILFAMAGVVVMNVALSKSLNCCNYRQAKFCLVSPQLPTSPQLLFQRIYYLTLSRMSKIMLTLVTILRNVVRPTSPLKIFRSTQKQKVIWGFFVAQQSATRRK